MSFDIRVISIREFLQTDVKGVVDLEQSKAILRGIAEQSKMQDKHHILLDIRHSESELSVMGVFELASSLRDCGIEEKNKIAVLTEQGLKFDRAQFFQLCANQRGFNTRAFLEFEEALDWLNS